MSQPFNATFSLLQDVMQHNEQNSHLIEPIKSPSVVNTNIKQLSQKKEQDVVDIKYIREALEELIRVSPLPFSNNKKKPQTPQLRSGQELLQQSKGKYLPDLQNHPVDERDQINTVTYFPVSMSEYFQIQMIKNSKKSPLEKEAEMSELMQKINKNRQDLQNENHSHEVTGEVQVDDDNQNISTEDFTPAQQQLVLHIIEQQNITPTIEPEILDHDTLPSLEEVIAEPPEIPMDQSIDNQLIQDILEQPIDQFLENPLEPPCEPLIDTPPIQELIKEHEENPFQKVTNDENGEFSEWHNNQHIIYNPEVELDFENIQQQVIEPSIDLNDDSAVVKTSETSEPLSTPPERNLNLVDDLSEDISQISSNEDLIGDKYNNSENYQFSLNKLDVMKAQEEIEKSNDAHTIQSNDINQPQLTKYLIGDNNVYINDKFVEGTQFNPITGQLENNSQIITQPESTVTSHDDNHDNNEGVKENDDIPDNNHVNDHDNNDALEINDDVVNIHDIYNIDNVINNNDIYNNDADYNGIDNIDTGFEPNERYPSMILDPMSDFNITIYPLHPSLLAKVHAIQKEVAQKQELMKQSLKRKRDYIKAINKTNLDEQSNIGSPNDLKRKLIPTSKLTKQGINISNVDEKQTIAFNESDDTATLKSTGTMLFINKMAEVESPAVALVDPAVKAPTPAPTVEPILVPEAQAATSAIFGLQFNGQAPAPAPIVPEVEIQESAPAIFDFNYDDQAPRPLLAFPGLEIKAPEPVVYVPEVKAQVPAPAIFGLENKDQASKPTIGFPDGKIKVPAPDIYVHKEIQAPASPMSGLKVNDQPSAPAVVVDTEDIAPALAIVDPEVKVQTLASVIAVPDAKIEATAPVIVGPEVKIQRKAKMNAIRKITCLTWQYNMFRNNRKGKKKRKSETGKEAENPTYVDDKDSSQSDDGNDSDSGIPLSALKEKLKIKSKKRRGSALSANVTPLAKKKKLASQVKKIKENPTSASGSFGPKENLNVQSKKRQGSVLSPTLTPIIKKMKLTDSQLKNENEISTSAAPSFDQEKPNPEPNKMEKRALSASVTRPAKKNMPSSQLKANIKKLTAIAKKKKVTFQLNDKPPSASTSGVKNKKPKSQLKKKDGNPALHASAGDLGIKNRGRLQLKKKGEADTTLVTQKKQTAKSVDGKEIDSSVTFKVPKKNQKLAAKKTGNKNPVTSRCEIKKKPISHLKKNQPMKSPKLIQGEKQKSPIKVKKEADPSGAINALKKKQIKPKKGEKSGSPVNLIAKKMKKTELKKLDIDLVDKKSTPDADPDVPKDEISPKRILRSYTKK